MPLKFCVIGTEGTQLCGGTNSLSRIVISVKNNMNYVLPEKLLEFLVANSFIKSLVPVLVRICKRSTADCCFGVSP